MVRDVRFDCFGNRVIQVKQRQAGRQFEHLGLLGKVTTIQFILDRKTRDQFVGTVERSVQPAAGPILTRNHLRFGANVVVKAHYGRLNVDSSHRVRSQVSMAERPGSRGRVVIVPLVSASKPASRASDGSVSLGGAGSTADLATTPAIIHRPQHRASEGRATLRKTNVNEANRDRRSDQRSNGFLHAASASPASGINKGRLRTGSRLVDE